MDDMPGDEFFWPMGLDTEGRDEEGRKEAGATEGPHADGLDKEAVAAIVIHVLLAERGGSRMAYAISTYLEGMASKARRWAIRETMKDNGVRAPANQMVFTWHED